MDLRTILHIPPRKRTKQQIGYIQQNTCEIQFFQDYIQDGESQIHTDCCKFLSYECFQAGDIVFHQGEYGDKFYIILTGTVILYQQVQNTEQQEEKAKLEKDERQLHHHEQSGRVEYTFNPETNIEFKRMSQGQAFGQLALLDNGQRKATIRCHQYTQFAVLKQKYFQTVQLAEEGQLYKLMEVLIKHDLFQGWELSNVRSIYLNTETQSYLQNQTVFKEKDIIEGIYVVRRGVFAVKQVIQFDDDEQTKQLKDVFKNINALRIKKRENFKEFDVCHLCEKQIFNQENFYHHQYQMNYSVVCSSIEGGELVFIQNQDAKQIIKDYKSKMFLLQKIESQNIIIHEKILEIQLQMQNYTNFIIGDSVKNRLSRNHQFLQRNSQQKIQGQSLNSDSQEDENQKGNNTTNRQNNMGNSQYKQEQFISFSDKAQYISQQVQQQKLRKLRGEERSTKRFQSPFQIETSLLSDQNLVGKSPRQPYNSTKQGNQTRFDFVTYQESSFKKDPQEIKQIQIQRSSSERQIGEVKQIGKPPLIQNGIRCTQKLNNERKIISISSNQSFNGFQKFLKDFSRPKENLDEKITQIDDDLSKIKEQNEYGGHFVMLPEKQIKEAQNFVQIQLHGKIHKKHSAQTQLLFQHMPKPAYYSNLVMQKATGASNQLQKSLIKTFSQSILDTSEFNLQLNNLTTNDFLTFPSFSNQVLEESLINAQKLMETGQYHQNSLSINEGNKIFIQDDNNNKISQNKKKQNHSMIDRIQTGTQTENSYLFLYNQSSDHVPQHLTTEAFQSFLEKQNQTKFTPKNTNFYFSKAAKNFDSNSHLFKHSQFLDIMNRTTAASTKIKTQNNFFQRLSTQKADQVN